MVFRSDDFLRLNGQLSRYVETGVSPAIQKSLRNNANCDRSVLEAQTTKAPAWSQTDLRLNVSTTLPHREDVCLSLQQRREDGWTHPGH